MEAIEKEKRKLQLMELTRADSDNLPIETKSNLVDSRLIMEISRRRGRERRRRRN